MLIEVKSGVVADADFEADGGDEVVGESAFDFEEDESGEAAAAVFGSDADGGEVSDAVGFDDGDGESDHFVIIRADLSGDGIGVGEEVAEGFAFIGFAVDEAAQVELPELVEIGERERQQSPLEGSGLSGIDYLHSQSPVSMQSP